MKLDVLAFGSHPDDVELSCSGTLIRMAAEGKQVGIADLTRGEMGTRGNPDLRDEEAAAATAIMKVHTRVNVGLRDGWVTNDEASRMKVIEVIRRFRPKIVLANAVDDRHPDHGSGSRLVRDAAFLSGLAKIQTSFEGRPQAAWRPEKVFFYIQDHLMIPDFVIDISAHFKTKLEAIAAYKSQFWDPQSEEPETYISTESFWHFLEARGRETGHLVGVEYGEGFLAERPLKIDDMLELA